MITAEPDQKHECADADDNADHLRLTVRRLSSDRENQRFVSALRRGALRRRMPGRGVDSALRGLAEPQDREGRTMTHSLCGHVTTQALRQLGVDERKLRADPCDVWGDRYNGS